MECLAALTQDGAQKDELEILSRSLLHKAISNELELAVSTCKDEEGLHRAVKIVIKHLSGLQNVCQLKALEVELQTARKRRECKALLEYLPAEKMDLEGLVKKILLVQQKQIEARDAALDRRRKDAETRAEQLETQKAAFDGLLKDAKARIEQLETRCEAVHSWLKQAVGRSEQLEIRNAALDVRLKDAETRAEQLETQKAALDGRLKDAETRAEQPEAQRAALNHSPLKQAVTEAEQLEADKEGPNGWLEDANTRAEQLQTESTALNGRQKDRKAKAEMEMQKPALAGQLKDAMTRAEKLETSEAVLSGWLPTPLAGAELLEADGALLEVRLRIAQRIAKELEGRPNAGKEQQQVLEQAKGVADLELAKLLEAEQAEINRTKSEDGREGEGVEEGGEERHEELRGWGERRRRGEPMQCEEEVTFLGELKDLRQNTLEVGEVRMRARKRACARRAPE